MKVSSLNALEIVILTNSGAASDQNYVNMMTLAFPYNIPKYMGAW